jgi:hypothetical protein
MGIPWVLIVGFVIVVALLILVILEDKARKINDLSGSTQAKTAGCPIDCLTPPVRDYWTGQDRWIVFRFSQSPDGGPIVLLQVIVSDEPFSGAKTFIPPDKVWLKRFDELIKLHRQSLPVGAKAI